MGVHMRKYRFISGLLLLLLGLCSCTGGNDTLETVQFTTTEILLPMWEDSTGDTSQAQKLECINITDEGIICVFSSFENDTFENQTWNIQYISNPYLEWKCYTISSSMEYQGNTYTIKKCCIAKSGEVYFLMDSPSFSLVTLWRDGTVVECYPVERDVRLYDMQWVMDSTNCSFFFHNSQCFGYDKKFRLIFQDSENRMIDGILNDTHGNTYAFLGRQNEMSGYRIYSYPDWQEIVTEKDLASGIYERGRYIVNQDENILCVSQEGLFAVKPYSKIVGFQTQGITFDSVIDAAVLDEDKYLILVKQDERYKLLSIDKEQGNTDTRIEITISAISSPFLEKCIYEFNNTNTEYYLSLEDWDSNKEYFGDFADRQQLEISAGKGPDIIDEAILDIDAYARNGYLVDLSDFIDFSKYNLIPTVLDSGKVDGEYYVAPYSFQMFTLASTKRSIGNISNWNIEKMCELLQEHGISALYPGARKWDFLYCCIAMDEDNTTFVDWNNNRANFLNERFLLLLQLANKYEDKETGLVSYNIQDDLFRHKYLVERLYGDDSFELYKLRCEQLGEDLTFIGFPMTSGNGTMLNAKGFVVNSSSKNKDGAIEFLEYIMSPKAQSMLIDYGTTFPSNQEVFEQTLTQLTDDEDEKCLHTTEANRLREIISNSKPMGKQYQKIINILYEETEGYFNGNYPAQKVAESIQNRVQLLLDEY